jgi:hypothetical protein
MCDSRIIAPPVSASSIVFLLYSFFMYVAGSSSVVLDLTAWPGRIPARRAMPGRHVEDVALRMNMSVTPQKRKRPLDQDLPDEAHCAGRTISNSLRKFPASPCGHTPASGSSSSSSSLDSSVRLPIQPSPTSALGRDSIATVASAHDVASLMSDIDSSFLARLHAIDEIGVQTLGGNADPASLVRRRLKAKGPRPESLPEPVRLSRQVQDVEVERRTMWQARQMCAAASAKTRKSGTYAKARVKASANWKNLLAAEQSEWIERARPLVNARLEKTKDAEKAIERNAAQAIQMVQDERAHGCLLTWNGPWLQDKLASMHKQFAAQPKILVDKVSCMPDAEKLFDTFWAVMEIHKEEQGWEALTASLELSLKSSDAGRVHLHCMVSFPPNRPHCGPVSRRTVFDHRSCSHWVAASGRKGPNGRSRCLREGHYYLQAPKIGKVLHRTTWQKHEEFRVDGKFILNLWQMRKISDEDCKIELVDSRDRIFNNVTEIEKSSAVAYRVHMDVKWKKAQDDWQAKPFRPASADEVQWMSQYGDLLRSLDGYAVPAVMSCAHVPRGNTSLMRRFNFILYEGGSKLGKTERACHWWGATETLLLNCQNVEMPNLREFMKGNHRAIVFDEADWRIVSNNRALFQASPRPVMLSQSQCNESAYSINLYQVPLILCSNDFWKGCDDWDAWDWINANCYHIKVTHKTWIDPEDAGSE